MEKRIQSTLYGKFGKANGYHYDFNSLYPYVMETNLFPQGPFRDESDPRRTMSIFNMMLKHPGRYPAAIIGATVNVPAKEKYPVLPVKLNNKLLFCTGTIKGVWTKPELLYAIERGAKIISVERICIWSNVYDYFSDFIKWAKQGKLNSTGGKKEFYKSIQNSFYGKMGMGLLRQSWLWDIPGNKEKFIQAVEVKHYENQMGKFIEGWIEIPIYKAKYVQPYIAAYITALARLELVKAIHHEIERGNEVFYCDTDSLVLRYPMEDKWVDEKLYGKLKLENEIEKGIFLEPKLYYEKSITGTETKKGKGIPGQVLTKLDGSFYASTLEAMRRGDDKVKVFEGELRRRKIISSLKSNTDLDNPIVEKKYIDLKKRQKRNIDYIKNDSRPWDVKVFEDEISEKEHKKEVVYYRNQEREIWMHEHQRISSLWGAIKKVGSGIKPDRDYPFIPKWMLSKKGKGLDVFVDELTIYGFYFESADELYLAVQNWFDYQCP